MCFFRDDEFVESEVSGNLPDDPNISNNKEKSPKRKKLRPEISKTIAFISSRKALVPESQNNEWNPAIQSLICRSEVPDEITDRERLMLGIEVINGKKSPNGKSFSGQNLRRQSKTVHLISR